MRVASGRGRRGQGDMVGGLAQTWVSEEEGGGRGSTLLYTATWRQKPRWSLRPCLWAMCRQTSREVEAESTMTIRFSPVTRMMWIGMCFLDLTAWGQMKTLALGPGGQANTPPPRPRLLLPGGLYPPKVPTCPSLCS